MRLLGMRGLIGLLARSLSLSLSFSLSLARSLALYLSVALSPSPSLAHSRSGAKCAWCIHRSCGGRCRANMAHERQSRPDFGIGFQVRSESLTLFKFSPLRSAADLTRSSICDRYSGSTKFSTQLDPISHCTATPGTNWSYRWADRVFMMKTHRDWIQTCAPHYPHCDGSTSVFDACSRNPKLPKHENRRMGCCPCSPNPKIAALNTKHSALTSSAGEHYCDRRDCQQGETAGKPPPPNPKPQTLNPQPSILSHEPSTLHPQPRALNLSCSGPFRVKSVGLGGKG